MFFDTHLVPGRGSRSLKWRPTVGSHWCGPLGPPGEELSVSLWIYGRFIVLH